MDGVSVDVVRELLASGMTYSQISSELKQQFPHILRGLSERSVRRFVKENSLKEVVKRDVVDAVKKSVGEVGETYGRKMMKGYVEAARGVRVSERTLKQVLPAIAPFGHFRRQTNSLEHSNPAIYSARYFGHKVHLDQNEKLVHFGVTYVMARDGFSGKIVGAVVMPRKNNLIIYDAVYRSAVVEFGLWNQVRVDHGKEFYLTLYVHEKLRVGRGDEHVAPYAQTTSTCNHVIERMWVELNHHVTYPVKRIMTSMEDQQSIDMSCPVTKFCVSTVLCRVCKIGMDRMVLAWNAHPIPGRGIPNTLQMQNFHTSPIHPAELPQCSSAVSEYRQQGGRLTDPTNQGNDPLQGDDVLFRQREQLWLTECAMDVDDIFSETISGNTSVLENAIISYRDLTFRLAP